MILAYIAERKDGILARYNAGMSLRRISEIYGVTTHDVEDVVKAMTRANAPDKFIPPALRGPNGVTIKPVKNWDTFSQEIQSFALRVAENFKVPVVTLFKKGGRTHTEALARGCFYHTLKTRHGWSAARIGRSCDRTAPVVVVAINLYCESMGVQKANLLKATA